MSCVTCQVSHVRFHGPVSRVKFHIFFLLFLEKLVELVGGGSVTNGATPSSFLLATQQFSNKFGFIGLLEDGFVFRRFG